MLSFKPTPKIENALKTLQERLVAVYQSLDLINADERSYLNKCALVSNIGASTRIENAVLTDAEIEWVDTILSNDGKTTAFDENRDFIINKLSKDRERSIEEVIGCRDVLTTVYLQAKVLQPLTESTIRGLHYDLLKHYPVANYYAGKYKTVVNKVVSRNFDSGDEHTVLDPTPPGIMTDIAMQELVQWYNKTLDSYHWPILVAIEFVFRFLAIHPFQDGNGRIGRALFILSLLQSNDKYLNSVAFVISIDRQIERNKNQYYTVLQQTSNGKFKQDASQYKYDNLVWFFLKVLNDAISDVAFYRLKYKNHLKLSETALAVLECFKMRPEKKLKLSDIEQQIDIPKRTIQYALKGLVEKQFIQKLGQAGTSRYQLIF